jgi:phage-related protein (TIGR01555 family)
MSLLGSFGAALGELVQGVSAGLVPFRSDGWQNLATGYGTSRDKTMAATFERGCALDDVTLSNLYSYDDLAGKVCDVYPKEEFRVGFAISGFDPGEVADAEKYLRKFEIPQTFTDARIWGNVYGGSAIWPLVDDGMSPDEPLDLTRIRSVMGTRVIDRRWLIPETWYFTGPKAGYPELYRVVQPTQGGALLIIGRIHESRLIRFPGARTEWQRKLSLLMWDESVLVKAYAALRSAGQVWQAIENLVSDANQGVFKIQHLFDLVTADPTQGDDAANFANSPSGKLLKRIAFMDRSRSSGRAIVLDKDLEDFERKPTSFAGLPELSQGQWQRVAAASDIPVSMLIGEAPAGLNATGSAEAEAFHAKVRANQEQIDEPRLRQLMRILFSAQDAPKLTKKIESPTQKGKGSIKAKAEAKEQKGKQDALMSSPRLSAMAAQYGMLSQNQPLEPDPAEQAPEQDPIADLEITWLPLRALSAAELSDLTLKRAQAGVALITAQVLLPEEVALSLDEDSGWKLDKEMRENILEENAEELLQKATENKLNPPENDPEHAAAMAQALNAGKDPNADPDPKEKNNGKNLK